MATFYMIGRDILKYWPYKNMYIYLFHDTLFSIHLFCCIGYNS